MKRIISVILAMAAGLAFAGAVPTATVTEIANKTINVKDKGTVTLDAAYKFEAAEASADYSTWIADFVVTFDRDVAEGEVGLYGQATVFGNDWQQQNIGDVKANEPKRLINEKGLTYATLLSVMPEFNCGAKSNVAAGLRMTVELRLYNPSDSTDWVAIARVKHKFAGKWFDANIQYYESWTNDASKAYGGRWTGDLANADVTTPGELSIGGDLAFDAAMTNTLGKSASKVTFDGTADFGFVDIEVLPAIGAETKGGVLVAKEDEALSYYAIARDGDTNAWVKLEGPAVEAGVVPLKITLVYEKGVMYATYSINGADYSYGGKTAIEVVAADGALSGVGFGGTGKLGALSATATALEPACGMIYFVR